MMIDRFKECDEHVVARAPRLVSFAGVHCPSLARRVGSVNRLIGWCARRVHELAGHCAERSVAGAANENRSPAHAVRGTACSSRSRSSRVSVSSAPGRFSVRRSRRLVPGIGTTSSPWAKSHAS